MAGWRHSHLAGAVLLLLLLTANVLLLRQLSIIKANHKLMAGELAAQTARFTELSELKEEQDKKAEEIKQALTNRVSAKKIIYDSGVSLQEEKRLLEKQLEILETWLSVDEATGKIYLMRGEQSSKSYPFIAPLKLFANTSPVKLAPYRVISKERYAHPERKAVEKESGLAKWEPPQTGTSLRDSALGEYVVFTSGSLIFHAPVSKKAAHDTYPHICAGISRETAKKIYESVFIGTKITVTAK